MATKYQVLSHITHDGKPYPEGATIKLEEEQAKPLLDFGRIAAMPDRSPPPGEGGAANGAPGEGRVAPATTKKTER